MSTEYDQIAYISRPFRQTHPDRLATLAIVHGLTPPNPATARVLDIGCGNGGNILPMAACLPDAHFFGFDLAATVIADAEVRRQRLGLNNVRLEALDVMEFPEDAGQFDYIIAHGFYSWVPDPARLAMWKLIEKHLSPHGVAYVSFNAYPGAMLRHAWRDAAAFHTRGITDINERKAKSVEMLRMMASATKRAGPWEAVVQEMVKAVDTKGENWVIHDDFGPFFQPYYFHQIADSAGQHGLRYLSDASYYDMQPHEIVPDAKPILDQLAAQSIELREQYYDFLELRAFRQLLLCRQDQPIARPVDPARLQSLEFSTAANTAGSTANGVFAVHNPLTGIQAEIPAPYKRILDQIRAAWPNSVPFSAIFPSETNRAAIAQIVDNLWGGALIEAHAVPQRAGDGKADRPVVWHIARDEAAQGLPVTTRLHTQTQLDDVSAKLVARLDGTASRSDLAAEFEELDERLLWLGAMGLLDPTPSHS
ncbi:SAM-dependent methyltransferase [Bryobacterales bacterium F-183]|nr:SAM-dependent methyltransferase [Bryobacterales bacterium F-183]